MTKLCIYSGPGASRQNVQILESVLETALSPFGFTTCRVTEKDILRQLRDPATAMFVLGGGEFTRVRAALGEQGLQAVQDYVLNGGCYLGSCMGGYAGARDIAFEGADGLRTNQGFGFFEGVARGSLPLTVPYDGHSRSATVTGFQYAPTRQTFPALYWGGPDFHPAAAVPLHKALFTHHDSKAGITRLLGVVVPVGTNGGRAILSGCHVEAMSPDIIRDWTGHFSSGDVAHERLEHEIRAFAPGQFLFGLAAALDAARIVPGHSFLKQIAAFLALNHHPILA